MGCLSGNALNVMRPVTVASSHPSAYCWPEAEGPGDCSAELQAGDRFAAAALPDDCSEPVDSSVDDCSERAGSAPDDCWVAAPDDHCAQEVRLRGSAAEDSAQAGYSASADSSRADCWKQVAPVPGGSAVRTQDDHSGQEVRTADYSAQADSVADDSVADDSAARCLPALFPDGYQADSQPVA